MIEIVKDNRGTEYKLVKRNRVNWIVEELESGKRLQGNGIIFQHVRFVNETVDTVVNPLIRIGARVVIKHDAAIRKNPKFRDDQDKTFVLIGFGNVRGDFKAIEEGGNARNAFWSISAKDLALV